MLHWIQTRISTRVRNAEEKKANSNNNKNNKKWRKDRAHRANQWRREEKQKAARDVHVRWQQHRRVLCASHGPTCPDWRRPESLFTVAATQRATVKCEEWEEGGGMERRLTGWVAGIRFGSRCKLILGALCIRGISDCNERKRERRNYV